MEKKLDLATLSELLAEAAYAGTLENWAADLALDLQDIELEMVLSQMTPHN